jgi:hypothetical protein
MIKIDKGVAPEPQPPRSMKYPWLQLDIGDSFEMNSSLDVAKIHARQASLRYGKTFEAQMYKGRPRIWRWA